MPYPAWPKGEAQLATAWMQAITLPSSWNLGLNQGEQDNGKQHGGGHGQHGQEGDRPVAHRGRYAGDDGQAHPRRQEGTDQQTS